MDASGSGYEYVYQYKDHLGNIRLSYKNTGSTGSPTLQIQEENNYYPFGLKHKGYNGGIVSEHSYKTFQGQEFNQSLDLNVHEFSLRQYDPALGRFFNTDPYEQFMSPYVAMGNNPVVSIDPDGGKCYDINGNEVACPDGEEYDDYRDDENHMTILPEVDLDKEETEEESDATDLTYKEWHDIYVKPLREVAANKKKEMWMDDFYAGMSEKRMAAMKIIFLYVSAAMSLGDGAAIYASLSRTTIAKNIVYESIDADGVVQYVGITNNLFRRMAEHLRTKGIQIEGLKYGLSRADARAVEQALIEHWGLKKNGGTLMNKINSISPNNPEYAKLVERGYEILRAIGYQF